MSAEPDHRRCAVLGSPIRHSLSPALHRAAYAALGLEWSYEAVRVDAAELPGFVDGLDPAWRGLSLTMPLKVAALALCEDVDAQARLVRAVNTVVCEPDGRRSGWNTDIAGIAAAVEQACPSGGRPRRVLVVGSGATARSTVAAAARLGAGEVVVAARSVDRAAPLRDLADPLGVTVSIRPLGSVDSVGPVDLAVSTVPASAQAPTWTEAVARWAPAVLDVVYDPWETPLLQRVRAGGGVAIGGFELLVQQGAGQVELFTGRPAPVPAMRRAGLVAAGRVTAY